MSLYQITWFNYCLLLFGLSWAFTGIYRRYALNRGYVDSPNVRSSHTTVTPRGGGIVFSLMWLALLLFAYYEHWIPRVYLLVFSPALLVALVGFRDDMKSLSPKTRLLVQAVACCACLYFLKMPSEPLLGITLPSLSFFGFNVHYIVMTVLMVFGVLWMTNLMNFMDGTDGLCATQAIIILGFGGFMFYSSGAYSLSVLSIGACALIFGFLVWNWPCANIFMGDCGSGFLGFVISIMALAGHKWFKIPYEIWIILASPFWFDASITLVRRMLKGEKWTQAHCLHAYQRLTHVGWRHLHVLIGSILVNCVTVWMAWIAFRQPHYMHLMVMMSTTFVGIIYFMIEIYKPMYRTWHA